MTNRELALKQALVAVLAAAKTSNVDIDNLVKKAHSVVLDSSDSNNMVGDKDIQVASCDELDSAARELK